MNPPSIALTLLAVDLGDMAGKLFAVIAGLLTLGTAAFAYLKSGRHTYSPTSGSPLGKVQSVEAPPPRGWAFKEFPDQWDSVEVRRRYWQRKRRIASLGRLLFGVVFLAAGYLVLLVAHSTTSDWLKILGLLVYFGVFVILFIVAERNMDSLDGEPWLKHNVSEQRAVITMTGSREDVMSRCISALLASGVAIIEFDAAAGSIVGSTGSDIRFIHTPERVTLNLEPVTVHAEPMGRLDVFRVEVVSEDVMPATEGILRPNLYNVRHIVAELASSAAPELATSAAPVETVQQEPRRETTSQPGDSVAEPVS